MSICPFNHILVVSTFHVKATGNHHIIKGVTEGIRDVTRNYEDRVMVENCFVENAVWKITNFKPDFVLFLGPSVREDIDFGSICAFLRLQNAKTAFWITDDPYEFDSNYRYSSYFDYIFTNDLGTLPYYFNTNKIYHLPLAASVENDYRDLEANLKDIDVFFCGYPYKNRKIILQELCKYTSPEKLVLSHGDWDIKGATYISVNTHKELVDLYARSKFVLNLGRTYNIANNYYSIVATTPGPRTFETALAGATQIYISNSLEINNYFSPNSEIIIEHNVMQVANIIEKGLSCVDIDYIGIAKKAQQRVLNSHLYSIRINEMFHLMLEV